MTKRLRLPRRLRLLPLPLASLPRIASLLEQRVVVHRPRARFERVSVHEPAGVSAHARTRPAGPAALGGPSHRRRLLRLRRAGGAQGRRLGQAHRAVQGPGSREGLGLEWPAGASRAPATGMDAAFALRRAAAEPDR